MDGKFISGLYHGKQEHSVCLDSIELVQPISPFITANRGCAMQCRRGDNAV
jgi:hypothetical protein